MQNVRTKSKYWLLSVVFSVAFLARIQAGMPCYDAYNNCANATVANYENCMDGFWNDFIPWLDVECEVSLDNDFDGCDKDWEGCMG